MDYYQLLGIPRQATANDIRTAYKQLARRYHPDLNPGNTKAEELFKYINAAYDVLSDPDQKRLYDMRLNGHLDFVLGMQTAQQHTAAYRRKYGTSKRKPVTKAQETAQLLNEYERAMKRFPLWMRYITSAVILVISFTITFYSRPRFENGRYSFLVLFGIMLFFAGAYQLYKTYFVHLRARLLKSNSSRNYERKPLLVFLLVIALGVMAHIAGTTWRKRYHLRHYQAFTIGHLTYQQPGGKATYTYIADNKEITASFVHDNSNNTPSKVIILYSYEDPYLSTIYYELK